MPALANVCAKGIAKGGKSIFKFRGKDYDVKLDKPLTAKKDRDPSADPTKPPGKTKSCTRRGSSLLQKRLRMHTTTLTRSLAPREVVKPSTCNYLNYGQACLHYSSVMSRRPALSSLTCIDARPVGAGDIREVRNEYSRNHHTDWINGWMQAPNIRCERDEFPPAAIWQARDRNVWIRLSPGDGNGRAGQMFRLCPQRVRIDTVQAATSDYIEIACQGRNTEVWRETVQAVDTVLNMHFDNMPNIADAGLTDNPCWPSTLIDDPGFALNFNDPWYNRNANANRKGYTVSYPMPPGAAWTNGKVNQPGWNKRDVDPNEIYVDEGNSSRRLTDQELLEEFGILRCQGDCTQEMEKLGYASLPVIENQNTSPPTVEAMITTPVEAEVTAITTTTATNPGPTTLSTIMSAATRILQAAESLITASAQYALYEEELYDDGDDYDDYNEYEY